MATDIETNDTRVLGGKTLFFLIFMFAFAVLLGYGLKAVAPSDQPVSTAPEISVTSPKRGSIIKSPVKITGKAKGSWYFEGSFPVVIVDWDGKIIGEGKAWSETDWTVAGEIPFTATMEFTLPSYGDSGAIILQKDNPSGLPENDDAMQLEIRFR